MSTTNWNLAFKPWVVVDIRGKVYGRGAGAINAFVDAERRHGENGFPKKTWAILEENLGKVRVRELVRRGAKGESK